MPTSTATTNAHATAMHTMLLQCTQCYCNAHKCYCKCTHANAMHTMLMQMYMHKYKQQTAKAQKMLTAMPKSVPGIAHLRLRIQ